MSFATEVKHELVLTNNNPCCKLAQSYGLLLFGRAFSGSEISLLTENSEVADAFAEAVFYLTGVMPQIITSKAANYSIKISNAQLISKTCETLSSGSPIKKRINHANFQNHCCYASFVRGAFLACGTITNPDKEYHLEFSVSSKKLCEDLVKLFDEFGITPKLTVRGGSHILYIKNSTDIEDMLTTMGAAESAMTVMGTKMMKDVRNTVNRKVNFENANLKRTVNAATKQKDAILYIKETAGLDNLPKELQEIAKLRLENPEMSNSEIRSELSESLTLSGVNHRFARLIKISDELKQKKPVKERINRGQNNEY